MKFYLAGKIDRCDWRHSIVRSLSDHDNNGEKNLQLKTLSGAIAGKHDYVGPFFRELGGHGEAHGPNSHGRGLGEFAVYGLDPHDDVDLSEFGYGFQRDTKGRAFMDCTIQIDRADVVFAWLDDLTAYGTLVEIGIAWAKQKEIWVAGYPIEDLWFAFAAASRVDFVQHRDDTPGLVFTRMLDTWADQIEYGIAHNRRLDEEKAQREHAAAQFIDYARRNRPNNLRADVWAKSSGKCWYCGADLNPFRNYHIEHVNPKSKGGADTLDNLVPACSDCNLSKGGLSLNEFRWRNGIKKFWFENLSESGAA